MNSYNYNTKPILKNAFNVDVNNNIKELTYSLKSSIEQMKKYNSIMTTISNHNEHKHLENYTNAMNNLANNINEFIKLYNGAQAPYENNHADAVLNSMNKMSESVNELSMQLMNFIDFSKDNQILLNSIINKLNQNI